VVVSGASASTVGQSITDPIPYRLTITTTVPETVAKKPSQLVWLDFDGGRADYLKEFYGSQAVNRPAFNIKDFNLGNTSQTWFEQQVMAKIEQYYRDAGLGPDEIQFTLTKPALGTTYSTVIFGGTLDENLQGDLLGIAQSVDRDNSDRTDKAVILTKAIGRIFTQFMDSDLTTRTQQSIDVVANTGAHELGHILGLEHATEVNVTEPDNIMDYNSTDVRLSNERFETHNKYWYQPLGYTNEVDMLLRNIGSGTVIGT
jgi:hypothetical protein